MASSHEIPWRRLLIEGAAIVISILLAFWIDAWWAGLQETREEKVLLAALVEEFKEKKEVLKFRRTFNEEILSSTTALIRASIDPNYSMTSAEIDQHLAKLWWYNVEHEWETAVLDALIGGGDLKVISNPAIRIDLAKWPVTFRVISQRVGRDEEYFKNILMPFLLKRAFLPQVYVVVDDMPGNSEFAMRPPEWTVPEPLSNTHLLDDQEFVNILVEKADRHLTILDLAFSGLDAKLDETIKMLEAELSD